jgi:hypothetical protein
MDGKAGMGEKGEALKLCLLCLIVGLRLGLRMGYKYITV